MDQRANGPGLRFPACFRGFLLRRSLRALAFRLGMGCLPIAALTDPPDGLLGGLDLLAIQIEARKMCLISN
jgi:hypothetical protein